MKSKVAPIGICLNVFMCFPFFVGLNEGKAGHTEILSFRGFDFNRAKWQHADDNALLAKCDDGLANFWSRGIHNVFFPFLFWLPPRDALAMW